jgi:hypothetical protein
MKPKSIHFDSVFEKRWYKYLTGLTEKQKQQLRERLAIFKVLCPLTPYNLNMDNPEIKR